IEKMTFSHVAMCGDAAGDTTGFTFFKLLPHLRDRAADIKTSAERFDAFRAQYFKFFSSERDQLVLVFHIWIATVRRDPCLATSNRERVSDLLAFNAPNQHITFANETPTMTYFQLARAHELRSRRHHSHDC